jgi:hypothetical protein
MGRTPPARPLHPRRRAVPRRQYRQGRRSLGPAQGCQPARREEVRGRLQFVRTRRCIRLLLIVGRVSAVRSQTPDRWRASSVGERRGTESPRSSAVAGVSVTWSHPSAHGPSPRSVGSRQPASAKRRGRQARCPLLANRAATPQSALVQAASLSPRSRGCSA